MPELRVVSAKPVSVSTTGKVKTRKRKANSLGVLSTVADYVYPGGSKKLAKDATAQPFKKKRKRKAKAKHRPRKVRRNPSGILDAIRSGDRVTIVNRFGLSRTGRAVMRGPGGWVLNVGGRHGTPDLATNDNIVKVSKKKVNRKRKPAKRKAAANRKPAKRKAAKKRKPAKRKAAKNRKPAKRGRRLTRNPTSWGTSYFVSRSAAERYYKPYGYGDVKAAVKRKLAEGEIHIGKPPLKAGQRLSLTDGGKRYMISEG